ncbi:MAG TPA: peptide MFS transporter [Allosphingosinicella sp.]
MSRGLTHDTASDWFGQPRGLTVLFLTEMWEKFSFYGMRALLVYYMTKQLMIAQQQASILYGLYTAFVYLTPIAGGIVADRWLGRRRAVVIGGSIMALGHFMMAFEPLFLLALATIAIGNGLFLPSLPGQIEGLYGPSDPRRKNAYNIYYVGINLGAFLAPLACGFLGETYGWHWGFGAAGLGMVAGLAVYIAGGRYLPADPVRAAVRAEPAASRDLVKSRFAILLAVMAAVVLFRIAYEQMGNTVALWIDTDIDRGIGAGVEIPMTWFQSLNPLLVFALTPLLLAFWMAREKNKRPIPTARRMAMGAGVVALAYLLAAALSLSVLGDARAGWPWLLLFFLIMTAGELQILPVGLGLFGRLAPAGYAATAIATWFFAGFAGNLLAGLFGSLWTALGAPVFFLLAGFVAGASALALLCLNGAVVRAEAAAEVLR